MGIAQATSAERFYRARRKNGWSACVDKKCRIDSIFYEVGNVDAGYAAPYQL